MNVEEAIKHCEEVEKSRRCNEPECAKEHAQLAEWLKELLAYRATGLTPKEIIRDKAKLDAAVDCIEEINYQNRKHPDSWVDVIISEWREKEASSAYTEGSDFGNASV